MPADLSVAQRIKARRQLRRWSIRQAASTAGIAHTTWSRIERGEIATDNRFTLAAVAAALGCSVVDLVGPAPATGDRQVAMARANVSAVLAALVETDMDDPPTLTPRPLPAVAEDAELVCDLRLRCSYAEATRLIPGVLRECHAHTRGPDRAKALDLLTRVADAASFTLRYVGYAGEAWVASHRARDAARASGDPVLLGLAAWSLGHSATGCGAHTRALRLAESAVAELEPRQRLANAPELLGSLRMLAAFAHFAHGRRDDARWWGRQADQLAETAGDTKTLGLGFGPTNLNCWWISMEVDGGEPGKAVEIANRTRPGVLFTSRQASFYIDTARALARLGQDERAARMLLTAERLTPQRVHASSLVRACVEGMLDRGYRPDLRGLAERVGVGS